MPLKPIGISGSKHRMKILVGGFSGNKFLIVFPYFEIYASIIFATDLTDDTDYC